MFFKICRSSTADEDAHSRSVDRRAMPSLRNAFQNSGMRKQKQKQDSSKVRKANRPQNGASLAPGRNKSGAIHSGRTGARRDFVKVTTQGLGTEEFYTNPENLPSLEAAYQSFKQVYPRFKETVAVDVLREREYEHLGEGDHVCFDYSGFGLFSHRQQVWHLLHSSVHLLSFFVLLLRSKKNLGFFLIGCDKVLICNVCSFLLSSPISRSQPVQRLSPATYLAPLL